MMPSSRVTLLVIASLGSFLLWTTIYLVARILRPQWSAEWTCRAVTTLHAFAASGLGLLSAIFLGPWPFHYMGKTNTEMHVTIVVLSMGYFLFDFAWCVSMQTEGMVMLLHHVVSIFGFSYVIWSGKYGCEISVVQAVSELTNPLLQLRWFLKQTGRYCGALEKTVDWLFVCSFCSLRLGLGSAFFFCFFAAPEVDMIARSGGTAFYIISIVFSIQIVLYIYNKYCRSNTIERVR